MSDYPSYASLVERNFTIRAYEYFGDYQGDILFIVDGLSEHGLGVIITGYGSCGGCDWLESAYGSQEKIDDIAEELRKSVKYFESKDDAREYLLGRDSGLNYWGHEDGFAAAVETVLKEAEDRAS